MRGGAFVVATGRTSSESGYFFGPLARICPPQPPHRARRAGTSDEIVRTVHETRQSGKYTIQIGEVGDQRMANR